MSSQLSKTSNRIIYIHRQFKRDALKSKSSNSKRNRNNRSWKEISFPPQIKLIEDPDETLKYFNEANIYYSKGYNLNYDLSNVTNFSPESIAVFSACIASKTFTNGMASRGNIPKNYMIRKSFMESGFFDHVNLIGTKPSSLSAELLHKVTNNKVETEIAKKMCRYIMEKANILYNDDTEPLYVILVEAMQNTNNHASAKEDTEFDWWLYRYEDKFNKLIHFTFLDIGVGVFKSLPVISWRDGLKLKLGIKSNLDLVDDLLSGKIRSRTLRKDRGKGIPQIYDSSKDEMFENFYILSNDILINTKTDERTELKEEYKGTLYYWTIKSQN